MTWIKKILKIGSTLEDNKWWIMIAIIFIMAIMEYGFLLNQKHIYDVEISIKNNENMFLRELRDIGYLETINQNEAIVMDLKNKSSWLYVVNMVISGFISIVFLAGLSILAQFLFTGNSFMKKAINPDGSINEGDERNKALILAAIFIGCALVLSPIFGYYTSLL